MRSIIIALLAATFVSTLAEFSPEETFLQAQTTIDSMKKKGATNADCVDLANTMCKTVEKEVTTDQRLIDRLKDGKQCVNLGLKAVKTSTAHLVKTRRIQGQWKVRVTSSYHARVNFGYHTFSSLREGKCGQFFTNRSYRTASHRWRRNVKIEASWRGRVKEAIRVLVQVKLSRKRQVKRCHCATKKARNTLWRTVTKRSRVSRQIKAHAKCKMLKCVLKGTSLRSRKCRASLKRLRTKKLISATETVRGCGKPSNKTSPPPTPQPPKDPCKKWRAEHAADKKIKAALKRQVKFQPNKTVLTKSAKKILGGVAKILKRYSWMTANVQGHSTASGSFCKRLTTGRAKATVAFLRSRGCKNKFVTSGHCKTMIGMKIMSVSNKAGLRPAPKGCKTKHRTRRL